MSVRKIYQRDKAAEEAADKFLRGEMTDEAARELNDVIVGQEELFRLLRDNDWFDLFSNQESAWKYYYWLRRQVRRVSKLHKTIYRTIPKQDDLARLQMEVNTPVYMRRVNQIKRLLMKAGMKAGLLR